MNCHQDAADHTRPQQDSCLLWKLINLFDSNPAAVDQLTDPRDIRTVIGGVHYWSFRSVVDRFVIAFPYYDKSRSKLRDLVGVARLSPFVRNFVEKFLRYDENKASARGSKGCSSARSSIGLLERPFFPSCRASARACSSTLVALGQNQVITLSSHNPVSSHNIIKVCIAIHT